MRNGQKVRRTPIGTIGTRTRYPSPDYRQRDTLGAATPQRTPVRITQKTSQEGITPRSEALLYKTRRPCASPHAAWDVWRKLDGTFGQERLELGQPLAEIKELLTIWPKVADAYNEHIFIDARSGGIFCATPTQFRLRSKLLKI